VGLLTLPFRLPLLPAKGVVRLAELIQDEAERTFHDPATIRHELERIDEARIAGEITDDEATQLQQEVVARLTSGG
jgi:hypothetical protein